MGFVLKFCYKKSFFNFANHVNSTLNPIHLFLPLSNLGDIIQKFTKIVDLKLFSDILLLYNYWFFISNGLQSNLNSLQKVWRRIKKPLSDLCMASSRKMSVIKNLRSEALCYQLLLMAIISILFLRKICSESIPYFSNIFF